MFKRDISDLILNRIREPRKRIQVVIGPRQVGKTTAVSQALAEYEGASTYLLAEGLGMRPLEWLEAQWNRARLNAKATNGHVLVVDEIQKILGWSEVVKRLWDEDTFNGTPLKVVILGSSRLLLQHGLDESLAGRFEQIDAWHWSYVEMKAAFGLTVEEYMLIGGYPGAADLRADENRWRSYVNDAIVEPSISRDILQLEAIAKPALLRQTFVLAASYSARILSYQKMVGQLQDAGNTTTLAHYLRLLGQAGLVGGLEKHFDELVRAKASSPKLQVYNNALKTALTPYSFAEIRNDHAKWGHFFESAVGAHLIATARKSGITVEYWNQGDKEVDFVLRKGEKIAALEVKSEETTSVSGMKQFRAKYPQAKPYLIGGQGLPIEELFNLSAPDFLT